MSRKTRERSKEKSVRVRGKRRCLYAAAAAVLLAVLLFGAGRAMRSYPASQAAQAAMSGINLGKNMTVFEAEDPRAGLVFYPGALVGYEAYAPLMQTFASRGITCVLAEMPLDLAILDMDAAADVPQKMPEIGTWIIAGHSLGGAMAAECAAKHPQTFDALVLLGAYSQADLSKTEMKVLSVFGTEDLVLNRENYEASRKNYPESFSEVVIEGGCHAYFGDYGAQRGDGTPRVSRGLQIGMTASAVAALLGE